MPGTGPCTLPLPLLAAVQYCLQTCCASIWGLKTGGVAPEPGRPGPSPKAKGCARETRGRATRWESEQGVYCLGTEKRTLVPASMPSGGGEEAISSPSASYRTPMNLEPRRGRRQVAKPSKTLLLLRGSWASVAETAKWERALFS